MTAGDARFGIGRRAELPWRLLASSQESLEKHWREFRPKSYWGTHGGLAALHGARYSCIVTVFLYSSGGAQHKNENPYT